MESSEIGKLVYGYDDTGNTVREILYSSKGEIETILQNEFDGNSNKIRQKQSGSEGDIWDYSTYTYGKAGHEIRSDSFTANGVPYVDQTREYRDNGYLSQCCDYKVDGTVDWCGVYRYDEKNYLGSDEYNSVSNLIRFAIKEG